MASKLWTFYGLRPNSKLYQTFLPFLYLFLIAMASTLAAMASTLVAMASGTLSDRESYLSWPGECQGLLQLLRRYPQNSASEPVAGPFRALGPGLGGTCMPHAHNHKRPKESM